MTSKLYDQDFVEWARESAQLLRSGAFDQADIEHIAEELEDLGNNRRNALESRMTQVLMHLLKLDAQAGLTVHHRSWRTSVISQRLEIARLIKHSPSLKPELRTALDENYAGAVKLAASETGLNRKLFPAECPWSVEQILDEDFWPAGDK